MSEALSPELLDRMNAYWRAANYLTVGQIYLLDNPLLRRPLAQDDIKARLLGHWGTTPGLNFIYVHLNRIIRQYALDMIFVTGPGHGGPGIVANTYLEGTYSELYPDVSRDERGPERLFRQFSFPGGIPSHAAPETPGSINEGGELGYSLAHAFGAAFDNPELVVACVVGDGEAETGPLAASWHSNKFLDPARDGAVLPILHLNGYKIANPTLLARIPHASLRNSFAATATSRISSRGTSPRRCIAPWRRRSTGSSRKSARSSFVRARRIRRSVRVADDRSSLAQGLDRPEGSRRHADGRARGARTRCRSATSRNPAHLAAPRGVDEKLPARASSSTPTARSGPNSRLGASRRSAHGRQSARERRRAAERPRAARRSRSRRRRAGARRGRRGSDTRRGHAVARRDEAAMLDARNFRVVRARRD